jgi:hypothetical protein
MAPGKSGGLAATAAIVMEPYLWPSPDAVQTINALFDLPAHGREQDWENELAHGTRLGEFLAVLSQRTLDVDCRSALALLVLHSFTYADAAEPVAEMAVLARGIIHADTEVHQRMLSHWSEGFLEHEGWVRSILR